MGTPVERNTLMCLGLHLFSNVMPAPYTLRDIWLKKRLNRTPQVGKIEMNLNHPLFWLQINYLLTAAQNQLMAH